MKRRTLFSEEVNLLEILCNNEYSQDDLYNIIRELYKDIQYLKLDHIILSKDNLSLSTVKRF